MGKKLNSLVISDLLPQEISYFKRKYKTEDLDYIIKQVNKDFYVNPCSTCPFNQQCDKCLNI